MQNGTEDASHAYAISNFHTKLHLNTTRNLIIKYMYTSCITVCQLPEKGTHLPRSKLWGGESSTKNLEVDI